MSRRLLLLLAATAAFDGLRAGAALFRSVLDFPARSRIGVVAFAELSRATDLSARGIVYYAAFGIVGALLTCATAVAAWRARAPSAIRRLASVAAASSVAILLMTTRAAPLMFAVGRSPDDPAHLAALIEPFVVWSQLRFVCAGISFLATFSALTLAAARPAAPR